MLLNIINVQVEALDILEIVWVDCVERRKRRPENKTTGNQDLTGKWRKRKSTNIEKEQPEI